MILVDTSAWIHLLRRNGDRGVQKRVEGALQSGHACWCAMVRLELWAGAGGEHERRILRDFEVWLPELAVDGDVWRAAFDLARRARTRGITASAADLLIFACARHHGAELESADFDFSRLAAL